MRRHLAVLTIGILFGPGLCPLASAQETTGTPGSPSATTTIDGKYLPTRRPQFGGEIELRRQGIQALVAAADRAAQGRAQRAADHDR